jgi:hypothetical protein
LWASADKVSAISHRVSAVHMQSNQIVATAVQVRDLSVQLLDFRLHLDPDFSLFYYTLSCREKCLFSVKKNLLSVLFPFVVHESLGEVLNEELSAPLGEAVVVHALRLSLV